MCLYIKSEICLLDARSVILSKLMRESFGQTVSSLIINFQLYLVRTILFAGLFLVAILITTRPTKRWHVQGMLVEIDLLTVKSKLYDIKNISVLHTLISYQASSRFRYSLTSTDSYKIRMTVTMKQNHPTFLSVSSYSLNHLNVKQKILHT